MVSTLLCFDEGGGVHHEKDHLTWFRCLDLTNLKDPFEYCVLFSCELQIIIILVFTLSIENTWSLKPRHFGFTFLHHLKTTHQFVFFRKLSLIPTSI